MKPERDDEVEIEFGNCRKRPFRKEVKDYEEPKRKNGVVKKKPYREIETDDVEDLLDSSMLAKIR